MSLGLRGQGEVGVKFAVFVACVRSTLVRCISVIILAILFFVIELC